MMTPESLSREGSPTPQEIILAAPGSSPDQGTTISIPELKQDTQIQLGTPAGHTQTLKLTSSGLQLAQLGPGQPLQLTAAGHRGLSRGLSPGRHRGQLRPAAGDDPPLIRGRCL